jgi:hypothetical protein
MAPTRKDTMNDLSLFVAAADHLENAERWSPVTRWSGIAIEIGQGRLSIIPLVFPDNYRIDR